MIYQKLKEAINLERKAGGAKVSFYSLIISDIDSIAKKNLRTPTEEDCSKAINSLLKKTVDSIETLKKVGNRESIIESLEAEVSLLQNFLPPTISTEELEAIVAKHPDKKSLFKFLKDNSIEYSKPTLQQILSRSSLT